MEFQVVRPMHGAALEWEAGLLSQSPTMVTTITLSRLVKTGYESMLDYYESASPQRNEPRYKRPVRPVVLEANLVSYNWRGRLLDCLQCVFSNL
ncbi:MAG: hypothetical protein WKF87_02475 [Chryseolinea sp.]